MSQLEKLLANAAKAMGVALEELQSIAQQGERKTYAAGEYLFHESTPRLWVGWVEEGEVEIVCGAQAKVTHLSTLGLGALIAEGALMDDTPHSTSAFTSSSSSRSICALPPSAQPSATTPSCMAVRRSSMSASTRPVFFSSRT